MAAPRAWLVYVLYSPTARRSYVGATVNAPRRLRQHRGELVGGARATRVAGDWVFLAHVVGFATQHDALRFEWLLKRRGRRHTRGTPRERRLAAIASMLRDPEWVPRGLTLRQFPTTAV